MVFHEEYYPLPPWLRCMLHRTFAFVGDTRHGRRQTGGHQVRAAGRGQPLQRVRQARKARGMHFLPGNGGILRGDAGRCAPLPDRTRAYHGHCSALILTARIGRRKFHSFPITLFRITDPGREHPRPGSFVCHVVTGRVAREARPESRRSLQRGPMREKRVRVVPSQMVCRRPRQARRASV
jgi:hypothetical protein